MAAKRVMKSAVDFHKMVELSPEHSKAFFKGFAQQSQQYVMRVAALPDTMPAIDWATYKKRVPSLVASIEDFEKQFATLSVPYPKDGQNLTQQIDAEQKATEARNAQFKEASDKRILEIRSKLKELEKIPPVEHMSMEEFNHYYPEASFGGPNDEPTFWPHDEEETEAEVIKDQRLGYGFRKDSFNPDRLH